MNVFEDFIDRSKRPWRKHMTRRDAVVRRSDITGELQIVTFGNSQQRDNFLRRQAEESKLFMSKEAA
jgi:hypothetical protein